jgi:hypothetical protein
MNATFDDWVLPWLQNNVLLGRMGRWKAIYLLNGYDQVWSMIQMLRFLTNPDPRVLLATMPLDQDHTIANGNWSALVSLTESFVEQLGQVFRLQVLHVGTRC